MNYAACVFENAGGFCLPSCFPSIPLALFPSPRGTGLAATTTAAIFFNPDTPIKNIWSILIAKRQKICYNKKCFL